MKALIIFLLFVAIVVGGYFGSIILFKNIQSDRASVMGDAYVKELYSEYTVVGKICEGEDTNRDSYVSCDFRIKDPSNFEKVINLQCPTFFKSYTGNVCKESRLSIPGQS